MLDRFEPLLKIVCLALAALLLFQVVHHIVYSDPLGYASIPPLPKLAVQAEPKPEAPDSAPKKKSGATNSTSTNIVAKEKLAGTNSPAPAMARVRPPRHGGNFGPQFGGPAATVNLPAPVQTRVDRIKESEILGPFIRPMPMALMGIAEDNAFLRAPNGQTGMVKEGAELGGIKVLRIGINRVLVEEDGQKKELTLFEGFGSDSLMPKESDASTNSIITPNRKENP
jgi:hypothetical protein